MNDVVSIADFERAIQAPHGAQARLLAREIVKEVFRRKTVWEGEVLVFELLGHASARLCYAWEEDGQVMAVLGEGPVDSALAAVRASMARRSERVGTAPSRFAPRPERLTSLESARGTRRTRKAKGRP